MPINTEDINTYTNIYVDLSREDNASGNEDTNGIIICNSISNACGSTNPLSFNQFREYLRFDNGLTQTFHLKNSIDINIHGSSTFGKLGDDVLLETPHANKQIKIKNWANSQMEIDNPWHVLVTSASTDKVSIITNNDNVEIAGGEIILNGTTETLLIGMPTYENPNTNYFYNTIEINNMKLDSNRISDNFNNEYSYEILNYNVVHVYNSLFTNTSTSGSIYIRNDDVHPGADTEYLFVNSIYHNITNIIGSINDTVRLKTFSCTYTSPLSAFDGNIDTSNGYRNIFFDTLDDNNQYSWVGNSACESLSAGLSQADDFYYLDSQWTTITVSGTTTSGSIKYDTTFGTRDGIGPLSYPMLPNVTLSASTNASITTISNIDSTYDSIYMPSSYLWFFNEKDVNDDYITSSTLAGTVTHTYTRNGTITPSVSVISYNNWYDINSMIRSSIPINDLSMDISLLVTSSDYYDITYVELTSATVFDEIVLSAKNTTTANEYKEPTYNSWGYSFTNKYISYNYANNIDDILYKEFSGDFAISNGDLVKSYRYNDIGEYDVYVGVVGTDGNAIISAASIDIYPKVQTSYYVDLSTYNDDKWLYKRTGIYDTFPGAIDTNWSTLFKSRYSSYVYDNTYAVSADSATTELLDTPIHYNFDLELSFLRHGNTSIPSIELVSETFDSIAKVEWDTITNTINIYYYDSLEEPILYSTESVRTRNRVRDWRCVKGAGNTLAIRMTNIPIDDGGTDGLVIMYKIDDDNWVTTTPVSERWIPDTNKKITMKVTTDETIGIQYMKMQSVTGFPYLNGSEEYPLSYSELKHMITDTTNVPYIGMPLGDYTDRFLCKNSRKITEFFKVRPHRFFEIDAWNSSLYGPWMLIWDIHTNGTYPEPDDTNIISFRDTMLANGIMYSIVEGSDIIATKKGLYVPNIEISRVFDMWIVWQSKKYKYEGWQEYTRIKLIPTKWWNDGRTRQYVDIVGSTLNSQYGYCMAPPTEPDILEV